MWGDGVRAEGVWGTGVWGAEVRGSTVQCSGGFRVQGAGVRSGRVRGRSNTC